jgi:hypothetical protein
MRSLTLNRACGTRRDMHERTGRRARGNDDPAPERTRLSQSLECLQAVPVLQG